MTMDQIFGLIMGIFIWLVMSLMIYAEYTNKEKISFSYKLNYYYWQSLNWIGVVFFTICLKILLLPVYIIWLIYKLFTFGRS